MRVDIEEYELRLRHRWEIAGGAAETKRNAFVRIEQDGITGVGEAAFNRGVGESPESVRHDLQRAAGILHTRAEVDPAQLGLTGAARTAIEMAWLDWQAKRAGQGLAAFLGVPESPHPVLTSYSIGIAEPAVMAAKTAEASDFEVLKMKMGTEGDRENFAAVRTATDRPIRVDANGGWETRDEAARMIDWLAEEGGVELVEQPLAPGRLEDHAWLRERSALPLYLDEDACGGCDLATLAGACDGVNIKLMKSGGVDEALRAIAAARTHGLSVMLGCMIESSLAIAAALHLAATVDKIDLDAHLLLANDPYEGIGLADGHLIPPRGPGIGVKRRRA